MLEQYIAHDYLRFVVVLLGGFFVLRLFIFILEKLVLKLTVKTKTKLDDLLVKKLSKPLTFLVLMIVLRVSLNELIFGEKLGDILNKIVLSLIILAIFIVAYMVFFLIMNRGWKKFNKDQDKGKNQGMFHLLEGILKVVFVICIFLIVLSLWGVAIGPFLAGIGIGGIAIAFALQSSLANIFGGVSLILDDSVRVGDLVNLEGGVSGKILKIGLRSTKVMTFDNEVVIVPNGKLADSNIHNVAKPEPKSRVVIPFSVAYGSNIEKVRTLVLQELKKIKGFTKDPEPTVRFLEMGNSSLNFKAYFFVESFEQRFDAIHEANTRIYNALNRAKISIPFPQMDVHLKK